MGGIHIYNSRAWIRPFKQNNGSNDQPLHGGPLLVIFGGYNPSKRRKINRKLELFHLTVIEVISYSYNSTSDDRRDPPCKNPRNPTRSFESDLLPIPSKKFRFDWSFTILSNPTPAGFLVNIDNIDLVVSNIMILLSPPICGDETKMDSHNVYFKHLVETYQPHDPSMGRD